MGYQYGGSYMSWGDIPDWAYESVGSLLQALNAVEPSTYQHCLRVGEYCRKLAIDVGLNEYEQKVAEFDAINEKMIQLYHHHLKQFEALLKPEEKELVRNLKPLTEILYWRRKPKA